MLDLYLMCCWISISYCEISCKTKWSVPYPRVAEIQLNLRRWCWLYQLDTAGSCGNITYFYVWLNWQKQWISEQQQHKSASQVTACTQTVQALTMPILGTCWLTLTCDCTNFSVQCIFKKFSWFFSAYVQHTLIWFIRIRILVEILPMY